MEKKQLVMVTGGSGFIAVHCILKLLQEGYAVRTTLRSLDRQDEVRTMLKNGGLTSLEDLTFIQADLKEDQNWNEAVKDCTYVLHVASPTPAIQFEHEDEIIIPAKEGVLRVLKAAQKAGVKRVVLTSAYGAVGCGHSNRKTPYTEQDWTNLNAKLHPYQRSKTMAEQTAWEFIQKEGNGLEMATVNPVAVMGPALGADISHSNQIVRQMLNGEMKACPKIDSCYVDVRDVADLHFLAMIRPEANGQRFLATSGKALSLLEVAQILKKNLGEAAQKVPSQEIPNWKVKAAAVANPSLRMLVTLLGQYAQTSGEKARNVLHWSPRTNEEAIVATAQSLFQFELVK